MKFLKNATIFCYKELKIARFRRAQTTFLKKGSWYVDGAKLEELS